MLGSLLLAGLVCPEKLIDGRLHNSWNAWCCVCSFSFILNEDFKRSQFSVGKDCHTASHILVGWNGAVVPVTMLCQTRNVK